MEATAPKLEAFYSDGRTCYERPDLGILVSTVHYQGGWRVHLYTSPSEFISRSFATEEAAHNVAIKHGQQF